MGPSFPFPFFVVSDHQIRNVGSKLLSLVTVAHTNVKAIKFVRARLHEGFFERECIQQSLDRVRILSRDKYVCVVRLKKDRFRLFLGRDEFHSSAALATKHTACGDLPRYTNKQFCLSTVTGLMDKTRAITQEFSVCRRLLFNLRQSLRSLLLFSKEKGREYLRSKYAYKHGARCEIYGLVGGQ